MNSAQLPLSVTAEVPAVELVVWLKIWRKD